MVDESEPDVERVIDTKCAGDSITHEIQLARCPLVDIARLTAIGSRSEESLGGTSEFVSCVLVAVYRKRSSIQRIRESKKG